MEKVFASWSGGKDCCFACYKASESGYDVKYLLNMAYDNEERSRTHGLTTSILEAQSEAMGIPLLSKKTKDDTYEEEFKKAIAMLKGEGVEGGVFGDMDVEQHREWVTRVCNESGVNCHLPLWGAKQRELLKEFIQTGFKAIIVCVKEAKLGQEYIGRMVDMEFYDELCSKEKEKDITVCGEAGEYHTLVVDGPNFIKSLDIVESGKIYKDGYWFLDIKKIKVCDKQR